MNQQAKANFMERIHREYLVKNLKVRDLNSSEGFDFSSEKHIFEMKSRACIFYGKNPPFHATSNIWWPLSDPQIRKYEARHAGDLQFQWIFVHAFTRVPLRMLRSEEKIRESLYHRDIFISPWEIYKGQKLGKARENTKMGPYRNLSRKNLTAIVDFVSHPLPEGVLYLPRNSGLEYLMGPSS